MAKVIKGRKIYSLEICYNDDTCEIEYISESIDGDTKAVYIGDIDISEYFDDESITLLDNIDEVGVS
ncbi:MAG: hypothetical protein GOVbin655_6 [Prokaryotic dsDNA virus sp.]|nr:MAG: hypothetical protein GOVbin655_6 [Prokaryotic dsDNA virus sp.]|tara:strand:- start:963 stop:1163 length:201 start_codon:yes stop_codon:yes gene_type:complete